MTQQIKIVLADDHALIRDGLRRLLQTESGYVVVGEASDGIEAVTLARQLHPDILLLDLIMPIQGGLETLRILREHDGAAVPRVILYGVSLEPEHFFQALKSGARGVMLLDSMRSTLKAAVEAVMAGLFWMGPDGAMGPHHARSIARPR